MNEIWKPVPGYEGCYEVSDAGRVKSLRRKVRVVAHGTEALRHTPERILRPGKQDRFGHASVSLGRGNSKQVHALVLLAFVGPRPAGADIAHLNGDGADNRLCNLAYASRSENNIHIAYHGRRKVTVAEVVAMRNEVALGGSTKRRVAEKYGVKPTHLSAIIHRKLYKHV